MQVQDYKEHSNQIFRAPVFNTRIRENKVFPVGNFEFVAYLECAIIGVVLGLVSGILTSVITKHRIRGIPLAIDAILGAVGACGTIGALWRMGSPYDFVVAVIVALALPALHHGFRPRPLGTGRD